MRALEARMLDVLQQPAANCEPLRFLKYERGETFQLHHDAAGQVFKPDTPGGPRMWTLYAFLNDVPEGGHFRFPRLDISIQPKPGRAILWPHLLDTDLVTPDERTEHEGAIVLGEQGGRKYGVNLHAHRNNLRTRILAGCSAAADETKGRQAANAAASSPSVTHTFPYERLEGSSPLHDLIGHHATAAVLQLLAAGADADARATDGTTPLLLAAGRGLMEVAQALLDAGAAIGKTDSSGATPLHHAARQGHVAMARMLLETAGAKADVSTPTGFQPLHLATRNGQAAVAKVLIEFGANVDAAAGKGKVTALHMAARHGHLEMVRTLLASGADIRAPDANGAMPLHTAAAEGQAAAVALLLDSGEAADSIGARGITPLHLAAGLGKVAVVRLLIDAGADASRADAGGRTAFDYAQRARPAPVQAAVMRLLKKKNNVDGREL